MEFNPLDKLGPLVGMTARAMRRQLNRRLVEAGHNITAEQLILLRVLSRHTECNQQLISETSCKDKTSTTRMIDAMERNGLLERKPDLEDRRNNLIALTERGRSVLEELMPHILATHDQAAQGVPPQELELCKDVLRRILDNLIKADPSWPGLRLDFAPAKVSQN